MNRTVGDLMTRVVEVVPPDLCARDLAIRMKERNLGAFPVVDDGSLVGIVTDRDLALRVMAEGRDAAMTLVRDVMTREVSWCGPDEPLEEVLARMAGRRVRRFPVLDAEKHLVGMVSLGKIAETDCEASGEVLRDVLQP